MRKAVGLVFFLGCAGSPSLDGTEQEVADPNPSFSITKANFHSPVGGSPINTCGSAPDDLTSCATGPAAQIRWGQPAFATDQSGLGFGPNAAQPVTYGTPFELGTLTHFNWPTYAGTWAAGATLKLHLTVTGSANPVIVDGDVNIPFTIDETPNDDTISPCPYPYEAGNPCSDKVTFGTTTFNLGAVLNQTAYDLVITGFVNGANTVDNLVSDESKQTSAVLMGLLREHCTDADEDGVCDETDNCVSDDNLDQLDTDGDGKGDVCDVCPQHAEDDPDGDGECGTPEACPCDADWKNHGDYVTCVVNDTRERARAGQITQQQRASEISAAAQSSCGK